MALFESLRRFLRGFRGPASSGAAPWQACHDPLPMLKHLHGRASDRKLRLIGVACCCRNRHLLPRGPDESNHYAVELAERFADGRADRQELVEATPLFTRFGLRNEPLDGDHAFQTWQVLHPDAATAAAQAAWAAAWAVGEAERAEREAQAALLRDIFGDSLDSPSPLGPAALAHNDSAAVKLATVVYNERDPATGLLDAPRLAMLADALEEAGVDAAAALAHLRGPGPHCRGCHVVDALLGRG
jgi:hypothetical protein